MLETACEDVGTVVGWDDYCESGSVHWFDCNVVVSREQGAESRMVFR